MYHQQINHTAPPTQQISIILKEIISSIDVNPNEPSSNLKQKVLQLQTHFEEMNKCIEQRDTTVKALKQLIRYVEKRNEKSPAQESKEPTAHKPPSASPIQSNTQINHPASLTSPPSTMIPQMSKSAPELEHKKKEEILPPHSHRKRSASDADLSRQIIPHRPQFSLSREFYSSSSSSSSFSSSSFSSLGSLAQESGNEFSSTDSLPAISKKKVSLPPRPSPLSGKSEKPEKSEKAEKPEKCERVIKKVIEEVPSSEKLPKISNVLSLCNPSDVESGEEYYIETCFDSEDEESFIENENADEAIRERFLQEEDGKRRKPNSRLPNTMVLKRWIVDHWTHPYPSEAEKEKLCSETNLTRSQLNNWFTNARRRILIRKGKGKPFHFGKFVLPVSTDPNSSPTKSKSDSIKFDKENGGFPVSEKLGNLFSQFLKTSPILNAPNPS